MTRINIQEQVNQWREHYVFKLGVGGEVEANGSAIVLGQVTADAAFMCEEITGYYTTLTAEDTDGGACLLSALITDTGRSIQLFSDFIPLNVFLSPGRQRSSGIAGDPSHALFFPISFEHTFRPNSEIRIEVRSTAAYKNDFYFLFHGRKLRKEPNQLIED